MVGSSSGGSSQRSASNSNSSSAVSFIPVEKARSYVSPSPAAPSENTNDGSQSSTVMERLQNRDLTIFKSGSSDSGPQQQSDATGDNSGSGFGSEKDAASPAVNVKSETVEDDCMIVESGR